MMELPKRQSGCSSTIMLVAFKLLQVIVMHPIHGMLHYYFWKALPVAVPVR